MSTIKNLIEESRKFRKETVPLTLRIPQDLNDFIEEFAGQLSLSKQETMLNLLEEGVSIAKEELKKLDTIDEKLEHYNYHLLNTNKGNNYSDHEWMFTKGYAAAFYDPWKFNIDRIKKGDRVFLYENGIGIIAMGIGTGKTISIDYEGKKDECHYQELQEYKVLSKAMPSSEIKKTLNRNVVFLRTMSGVPNGKLLYDVILKDFM
ncbi:MAG: hypothetical protein GX677_04960 [Treponema sp.]|nr:hypothetical protein [Treponema sp.]